MSSPSAAATAFNTAYESLEDSLGGFKETRVDEIARWKRHVARFLGSRPLPSNARILDFGSGSGQWSLFVGKLMPNATVIGLDMADRAVASASARASELGLTNVHFVHYDGRTIPSFEGPFDCIICFGVLLYLEKDGVLDDLLQQLDDRLTTGGWFCAMEIFHRRSREGATFKTLDRKVLLDSMARRGYGLYSESIVYFSKAARYWLQATLPERLRLLRPFWRAWLVADCAVDLVVLDWLRLRVGERRFLVWRKRG